MPTVADGSARLFTTSACAISASPARSFRTINRDRPEGVRCAVFISRSLRPCRHVSEPNRYAVLKYDDADQPTDIVEKPSQFLSNWAVTGLYFYDNAVLEIAAALRPSVRGELEISDINRHYLRLKQLQVVKLGRGYTWLDTGTHDTLLEAAEFVRSVQHRQGLLVGCPEEVAYLKGFITAESLRALAAKYHASAYGRYLQRIVD